MEIVECGRNCSDIIRDVLENTMSWFHSYYALACVDSGICSAAVARKGGIAGVGVFYRIPRTDVGVVYYVAVLPGYRGRGVGKAIIASIEEILESSGVGVFMATTRRDNAASRRMLSDLGYLEIELESLDRSLEEVVTMATCGYEDDLLYIKPGGRDVRSVLRSLATPPVAGVIEDIWRKICYSPWRRLRRF